MLPSDLRVIFISWAKRALAPGSRTARRLPRPEAAKRRAARSSPHGLPAPDRPVAAPRVPPPPALVAVPAATAQSARGRCQRGLCRSAQLQAQGTSPSSTRGKAPTVGRPQRPNRRRHRPTPGQTLSRITPRTEAAPRRSRETTPGGTASLSAALLFPPPGWLRGFLRKAGALDVAWRRQPGCQAWGRSPGRCSRLPFRAAAKPSIGSRPSQADEHRPRVTLGWSGGPAGKEERRDWAGGHLTCAGGGGAGGAHARTRPGGRWLRRRCSAEPAGWTGSLAVA